MNYKSRLGISSPFGQGGGTPMMASSPQTVGGSFGTNFGVNASATGPALVLLAILGALVLDYVWTREHQGGRA